MKTGRALLLCPMLAVAAILGGMGAQAHAATLNVANFGVDSPGCGSASAPCRSLGMAIGEARDGDRIVLVGNVATGNVTGFILHGANEIRGNVASGNSEIGFRLLDAAGSTFMGNVAVANDRDGLTLASADGSQVRNNVFVANGQTGVRLLGLSTSAVALGQNNIFGNGAVPDSTTGQTNCGVVNELGGTQKAANNFWGSPSGPAGGPPANVPCNTTAGTTPVDPVAVRPFPISR